MPYRAEITLGECFRHYSLLLTNAYNNHVDIVKSEAKADTVKT